MASTANSRQELTWNVREQMTTVLEHTDEPVYHTYSSQNVSGKSTIDGTRKLTSVPVKEL